MKNDRFISYLSLAQKAGKVVSGEFMVENAIKGGSANLVIVAGDASANTLKKMTDMCNFRSIPLIQYSDKTGLGRAIGKEFRVSVAVLDEGFSKSMISAANGGNVYSEKESN